MHQKRSKESRKADYELLTVLAYRCNKDEHRSAALFIRDKLMQATKGKDNEIPEDKIIRRPQLKDNLPKVMLPPATDAA